MKIYVLSYNGCDGFMKRTEGVIGVFDSLERAQREIDKYLDLYDEKLIDYDCDIIVRHYFTFKGTYTIEYFVLNDSCIEDENEEDYDVPDDVDETFYDPYAGCNMYE